MLIRILCGVLLVAPAQVLGQVPALKEIKGFVVTMDQSKLVVSNIKVGGAGQTFVLPAPKDGAEPSWVAAGPGASGASGDRPKMMMQTTSDTSPLKLTELTYARDAFKPEDFPAGTEVVVSYEESSKTLRKLDRVKPSK